MLGEAFIARDHCGPGPAFRIHPESLTAAGALDHACETVLFGKLIVAHETSLAVDLPSIPAHRPMQQQAACRFGIVNPEGYRHRAAHTAAHNPRGIDLQMIEQRFAMAGIAPPTQTFDAPGGAAAFAPVIENDHMFRGQCLKRIDSGPRARHAPFVDGCVEAPWRAHQDRCSRTLDFIVSVDPIDISYWHKRSSPWFAGLRQMRSVRFSMRPGRKESSQPKQRGGNICE